MLHALADQRTPNVNCLWGEIAAGTLARLGVRHAVIAPGSRSAPLVWGFTRQKDIQAIPMLDERSAAFYALGLARASGQPVALVCTSGTAAANFLPAIIEASLGAVPLLVLTADRPPELRDCGAGQAIDQVKIYGHYPRWQHEVGVAGKAIRTSCAICARQWSMRTGSARSILGLVRCI